MRLSLPGVLLRAEGLALLGAAIALYLDGDYRLWPLLAFALAPDLLGYGLKYPTAFKDTHLQRV